MENSKLSTENPNHLRHSYQKLYFEIIGGVDTEVLNTLRVTMKLEYNRLQFRENLDLYNSMSTDILIRKISEKTSLSSTFIGEAFNDLITELERYRLSILEKETKTETTVELSKEDQKQATDFLKEGNILERTNQKIEDSGLIGNEKNRLITYLLYLSRKQETPLHAVIISDYNYLQTKIAQLVPEEDKESISHLSENALFFYEQNELSNKLVFVEDTGTNKKKLAPLFDLQSKGFVSKIAPKKDYNTGYLKTEQSIIKGPICLSISTPNESNFSNHARLSFVLTEDNNEDQDQKIMKYQKRKSAGLIDQLAEKKAIQDLQNMQRVLKPIKVVNPFAEQINLPSQTKDKQITNSHYLRFIEVITFYKQYQRTKFVCQLTGEEFIETTLEDIEEANELLKEILLKKCDKLNEQTRKYFEKLKIYIKEKQVKIFSNQQISQAMDIPLSTLKRYNYTLLNHKFLKLSNLATMTESQKKAVGYEYELETETENQDDFLNLESIVKTTLEQTIEAVKIKQIEIAKNQSEPRKWVEIKKINMIDHDMARGEELNTAPTPKTKSPTPKKQ